MAHKKGQGSSRNGRDSNSQRLGVKAHDGNSSTGGTIIVRQRGRRFPRGTERRTRQRRHDLRENRRPGAVREPRRQRARHQYSAPYVIVNWIIG